jgi:hypothetical protein
MEANRNGFPDPFFLALIQLTPHLSDRILGRSGTFFKRRIAIVLLKNAVLEKY